MNALTLKDLVSQTDNFEPEAIELVLNRVDEFDALGFGIDVVDWEVKSNGLVKKRRHGSRLSPTPINSQNPKL